MNESADIGQQKRTFLLELLRSVPQGFLETSGTTFGMYVAIRVFDVPVGMKMTIAAAASVGLLLSLFTCLLYTSPSPRDQRGSRMPSSA